MRLKNFKAYVRFKTCNGSRTVSLASVPKKLRGKMTWKDDLKRCLRISKSIIIDASQ